MISETTRLLTSDYSPSDEKPQETKQEKSGISTEKNEAENKTSALHTDDVEFCVGVEKLAAVPSGIAVENENVRSAGSMSPTRGENLEREQSPATQSSSLAWLAERREKLFAVKEAPVNYNEVSTLGLSHPLANSGNEERPVEVYREEEHEIPENIVGGGRSIERMYQRELRAANIREDQTAENFVYEAQMHRETDEEVEKQIRTEELVERLLEEARRLRGCSTKSQWNTRSSGLR